MSPRDSIAAAEEADSVELARVGVAPSHLRRADPVMAHIDGG